MRIGGSWPDNRIVKSVVLFPLQPAPSPSVRSGGKSPQGPHAALSSPATLPPHAGKDKTRARTAALAAGYPLSEAARKENVAHPFAIYRMREWKALRSYAPAHTILLSWPHRAR